MTGASVNGVVEIKYGSHLYGTSTENSDLDIKGVFVPSAEHVLHYRATGEKPWPRTVQRKRPKRPGEKNTRDDVDFEMISIDRFVELLLEGQTMALDMLFAPLDSFTGDGYTMFYGRHGWVWASLYAERDRFLSSDVVAFIGYARKQASRYGVKGSRLSAVRATLELLRQLPPHSKLKEHAEAIEGLVSATSGQVSMEKSPLVEIVYQTAHKDGPLQPYLHVCGRKIPFTNKVLDATKLYQRVFDQYGARALAAESNQGVDWKALSHALRVNSEAIELLSTGRITFPRPDRDHLLAVKKGQLPYAEVATEIEQGMVDLMRAQADSKLPRKPDYEFARGWLEEVYEEVASGS